MGPITVIVSGVCATGALAAVAWKVLQHSFRSDGIPEQSNMPSNVISLHPKISYGFSQGRTEHPKAILLRTLQEAKRSLDLATHTLTDLDVAVEIIKAHRRGVTVRIISDADQFSRNEYQRRVISELLSDGITVKVNLQEDALMRLGLVVADGRTVTVGAFNNTTVHPDNVEDVIVRIDDVRTAKDWQTHFQYMWNDKRRYRTPKNHNEDSRPASQDRSIFS